MLYSYPTLSVSHLRAMRDILAQKVFGILPVEETKGDKSFTVYADGSYKAEMPINYKISLAKRPVLLLEKDVQARANHYLDALKDIKDKTVVKNLGGISLLPDGVVIDRIEKAFPEDSKGEGWYWTVACVLKLRPSSEEDAIIVQGAGVQIDIASTGNIMGLHSTVLPIMQPKKIKRFNLLDALKIRTHLDLPPITTNDNTLLSRSVTPTTETTTTNLSEFYASPDFYGYNPDKACYAAYKQTTEGKVAAGDDGVVRNLKEASLPNMDNASLADILGLVSDSDNKAKPKINIIVCPPREILMTHPLRDFNEEIIDSDGLGGNLQTVLNYKKAALKELQDYMRDKLSEDFINLFEFPDLALYSIYLQAKLLERFPIGNDYRVVLLQPSNLDNLYKIIKAMYDRGDIIENIIIDSHGVPVVPTFHVGQEEITVSEYELTQWQIDNLMLIGKCITGSFVINACYFGRDKGVAVQRIADITKRPVFCSASWFFSWPNVFNHPLMEKIMSKMVFSILADKNIKKEVLPILREKAREKYGFWSDLIADDISLILYLTRALTQNIIPGGGEFWDYLPRTVERWDVHGYERRKPRYEGDPLGELPILVDNELSYKMAGIWYAGIPGRGPYKVNCIKFLPTGEFTLSEEAFINTTLGEIWYALAQKYYDKSAYTLPNIKESQKEE